MSTKAERDYTKLLDEEWSMLLEKLKTIKGIYIGSEAGCRRFVEGVLWILRSGAQWRLLPAERGAWNSIFKRFSRWSQVGVWNYVHELLSQRADLQEVSIDGTVIRAHACAAGAASSNAEAEALGKSRGGFSCKIHAVVDALGLPLKFILTGGQTAEITQAIPLMSGIKTGACLADKGYDADGFVEWLKAAGIEVIIPPKSNRKEPRACDYSRYKERHVVECMFGKLKYFRRIATRYEKKAINFMGLLALAAIMLWVR